MTDDEMSKCKKIIHGHAAAAAAGNLVPVPVVGLATDTVTMTTMAMALAAVLGGSITESVAKTMAINAIIATIKKQPIRIIAKEVSKIMPVVGQLVAPSISVAMLESAGWLLANELVAKRDSQGLGVKDSVPAIEGHNFKYERPLLKSDNATSQSEASTDKGHNFKYDRPFITHDD